MSLSNFNSHIPMSQTPVPLGPDSTIPPGNFPPPVPPVHGTGPQESPEPASVNGPRILFLDNAENFALFDSLFGEQSSALSILQDKQSALDFFGASPALQPLLIVLTNCSKVELDSSEILKLTNEHLFFRILQVTQKWVESSPTSHLDICLPFRNPGLPIRSFQLPEDEKRLAWEIDEFFKQAAMLETNSSRLLRFSSLTDREMRVAQYVTRGFPNKKISNVENVSEKTIEKWRKEMYEKLEVGCAAELVSLVTMRNFLRWPTDVPFPH